MLKFIITKNGKPCFDKQGNVLTKDYNDNYKSYLTNIFENNVESKNKKISKKNGRKL